ncbi:MAG: T9SS type B sorting domain-containing protein [Bacteroidetes bacterium]|nr:T9SS type B sorting domain-containing protein [Bacteroidota bacterium]
MRILIIIVVSFIITSNNAYAQKEARYWYFSGHNGIDFGNDGKSPVKLTNSAMSTNYPSGTISDAYGNLLFYSNSVWIWNRNHQYLKNSSLIGGITSWTQGALFVPHPGDTNIYYFFYYSGIQSSYTSLCYCLIDKRGDNNLGELISNGNQLTNDSPGGKLTAVRHENKSSIWVISHSKKADTFYSFCINKSGIDPNPVISQTGHYYGKAPGGGSNVRGMLKMSPDNAKLVATSENFGLEIFSFNNRTGKISNPISINEKVNYFGAEFSPNGKYLYLATKNSSTGRDSVFQFDVSVLNKQKILDSKILLGISKIAGYQHWFSALQLGTDGKIYGNFGKYLTIIKFPNKKGAKCGWVANGMKFLTGTGYGLPDFIQSYFFIPDFNAENTCFGDTTLLSLTDTTHIDSVLWDFGDLASGTFNSSSLKLPSHRFKDTGIYNVIVYVWHDQGEKDTLEREIRINYYPIANFSINDTSQCLFNSNFLFKDSSSIASGKLEWEWIFGDSTKSFDQHPNHSYQFADTFPVTLIVLSDYGCKASKTKTVYVNPMPEALFDLNDSAICYNEQHFLVNNLSIVNRDSINQYHWLLDSLAFSNSKVPDFVDSLKAGNHTLELITFTTHGCSDTTNVQFVVHPMPKAEFSINDSFQCFNEQNFIITNLSTVIGDSINKWYWRVDTSLTAPFDTVQGSFPFIDELQAATWNLQLVTKTSNNCTDSITKLITVSPSPISDFSIADTAQCFNGHMISTENISFIQGDSIILNQWIVNNSDTFSNYHIDSLVLQNSGIIDIRLITNTTHGCSDTLVKQAKLFASPLADFSINDSTQCLDSNSFDFTNQSVISDGVMSYQWIIENDTVASEHYDSITFTKWGKYTIQLIATSNQNCTDTTKQNIYVYPMPLAAFIYLNNCLEDTMWFFDSSMVDSGNITKWFWDFKNGSTSGSQNPFTIYYDTGQKSVTLVSTSDFGCATDTTRFFKIESKVTAPILERATVENDEHILVEWKKPNEGISKTYHLERSDDGAWWDYLSDEDQSTFSFEDLMVDPDKKSYYYRLKATDSCDYTGEYSNNGKSILLSIDTNNIYPTLTWTAYEEWDQGVAGYELQLAGSSSLVAGFSSLVSNLNFERVTSSKQPVAKFTDSLAKLKAAYYCYRVVAYRNNDSLQSVSNVVCIPAVFRIYTPNSFTPNNDGINDIFLPKGLFVSEYKLTIYNRWGEKLFESSDIKKGWDGSFKGKTCPLGTYYYSIKAIGVNGEGKELNGSLTLLR